MNKLNETSLSRLISKMEQHDCGTITAYRSEYTKNENQQRNRNLLAKLLDKRYGVTSVKGSYIENYDTPDAIEVGEHVFFIEDIQDRNKLEIDLKQLGEKFEQDSILFIPKPGLIAYLWGTNIKNPKTYPGYGNMKEYPNRSLGKNNIMMTKVRGRPFLFNEVIEEHPLPCNSLSKFGCHTYANMPWQKMDKVNEKVKFKKHKLTKKEANSLSLKENQVIYIPVHKEK